MATGIGAVVLFILAGDRDAPRMPQAVDIARQSRRRIFQRRDTFRAGVYELAHRPGGTADKFNGARVAAFTVKDCEPLLDALAHRRAFAAATMPALTIVATAKA